MIIHHAIREIEATKKLCITNIRNMPNNDTLLLFSFENRSIEVSPTSGIEMMEQVLKTRNNDIPENKWFLTREYTNNIKVEKEKSKCVFCGKKHGPTTFNEKGQCEVYENKFWEKVRKIYWHRYLQKNEKIQNNKKIL